MIGEQLYSRSVPYQPYELGRSLECISVKDFESYKLLSFDDILPNDQAEEMLVEVTSGVANFMLGFRNRNFGESMPISNMDRIAKFLGNLGIRPVGKLSYVNSLNLSDDPEKPNHIQTPGIMSGIHRQAFVIDKNAVMYSEKLAKTLTSVPYIGKELYIEQLAAHELVHLAGASDTVYFFLNKDPQGAIIGAVSDVAPCGLGGFKNKGGFFEEGFATLCAHMYLWTNLEGIAEDTRSELRSADGRTVVNLPVRHAFSQSSYCYAAWAMERLVEYSPDIWKIFIDSRTHEIDKFKNREALREKVDALNPGLFNALDSTNSHDLTESLVAADAINNLVKKEVGL